MSITGTVYCHSGTTIEYQPKQLNWNYTEIALMCIVPVILNCMNKILKIIKGYIKTNHIHKGHITHVCLHKQMVPFPPCCPSIQPRPWLTLLKGDVPMRKVRKGSINGWFPHRLREEERAVFVFCFCFFQQTKTTPPTKCLVH